MTLKIFSIQVEGIKCTNCAAKIKKAIDQGFPDVKKTNVSVMQEKVYVTLQNEMILPNIKEALKKINYPVLGQPILVAGGEDTERSLHFIFDQLPEGEVDKIQEKTKSLPGVLKSLSTNFQELKRRKVLKKTKLSVTYNCEIIKGREIVNEVEGLNKSFKIFNQRVDGIKNQSKVLIDKLELYQCLGLASFFLLFNMIFPMANQSGWYDVIMFFPQSFGLYSVLIIVNILLTIYTIIRFGKKFIINSFYNLKDYGDMNMETLVALGSVSAFVYFLFFFIRYSIQAANGEFAMQHMLMDPMMTLMDALSSSTLIVTVVTIGKYLQKKVKKKIQKMTDSIFPHSELFKDMNIHYVQLKNRNLLILNERLYDVVAIEKNDIIKLRPGRLLLDVIIISGKTKAIQSIMSGTEDVVEFQKGDRIRSGSTIVQSEGLAQVQNVFEKSVLLQIGAQINMAHNSEENNLIGIQAVCKSISNHFVKGVIVFSALVVIVWSLLIKFKQGILKGVDGECSACFVIERGLGVLVASCPCALGLAVPSVIAIALNLAIKSGILVRKNSVFEKIKKCNVVAFDKTGTLFTKVERIEEYKILSNKRTEKQLWEILAVMEKQFRHPLAELLYKQSINRSEVTGTNFKYLLMAKPQLEKEGITGKMKCKNNQEILNICIGNKNLLKKYKIKVPVVQTSTDAATCLYMSINDQVSMLTMLNTHSNLRPEAKDIVKKLQELGKEVHILSGDSRQSVQLLAQILNIPENCQHPQQSAMMKMEWIKSVQKSGEQGVMMIGDGLNDIPCLQQAQVGVSINAKSQLNLNAADIIILSENLYKIVALFKLMKKSAQFINLNLFWAFAYNIVMLPIVSGMLYSFQIDLSPVWSSIAMSGSSLVVVLFSQLMVCFTYDYSQERDYEEPRTETTTSVLRTETENISHKSKSQYRKLTEQIMN